MNSSFQDSDEVTPEGHSTDAQKLARPQLSNLTLRRRQFIIAREARPFGPEWCSKDLPDGFRIIHHTDLPVRVVSFRDREIVLLGNSYAISEDPTLGSPADVLSGRFAWIDWPYIYPDASALLSVYYGSDDATGPVIASSPALLAMASKSKNREGALRWGGLNWHPLPGSVLDNTDRLLRDMRLDIPSGRAEYNHRPIQPLGSFGAARERLAEGLTAVAQQVQRESGTVYLALTAGLDSRTLAASLLAAGTKFECVTLSFQGMDPQDVEIAGQISRSLGVKHHVVGPEARNDDLLSLWRDHTLGSYDDADNARLFPGNQYRFLRPGDLLIRGGCFELGRRFYGKLFNGLSYANATGEALWARFELGAPDRQSVDDLERWLTWRRQHDNGFDLTDAFYLDQRLGGWLSAIEQAFDTIAGFSVIPANSGRIFAALITPSAKERESGKLQIETIRVLAPHLLRFPVNPVSFRKRAEYAVKDAVKQVLPRSWINRLKASTR